MCIHAPSTLPKRYIYHHFKNRKLSRGERNICKLLLSIYPIQAQISYEGVFQALLALRKIINDTKEIVSTPAAKLSSDPDAWNLKLIIRRLHRRLPIHGALLSFPLGIRLFTEATTSGKCWVINGLLNEEFQSNQYVLTGMWSQEQRNVTSWRTRHLYSFKLSVNNHLVPTKSQARCWVPEQKLGTLFSELQLFWRNNDSPAQHKIRTGWNRHQARRAAEQTLHPPSLWPWLCLICKHKQTLALAIPSKRIH